MIDEQAEPLLLDAWHRARVARMVPFAGHAMPLQYEGIIAEHLWTRANAGLFDVSHMGQLLLSGPDVASALEALVPGDIRELAPGRMRYSLLLDDSGGIVDDLMIANAAPDFHLVVNGATKWDDIAHLREALPDAVTLNHMADHVLLALQGPKAAAVLARLVPEVGALSFMQSATYDWQGADLRISRSGYTGEDGFEISAPAEAAKPLADTLCGAPEVRPIGLGARDSLRLEAGLPLYGHDLSPAIDPVEAGLAFAIGRRRREAGDFPGADRILRHLRSGASVNRIGFTVTGKLPVREGAEVFVGDAKVGTVTSGGFSPSLDHPIGMALVDAPHAAPGTALEADVRGRRVPVTVAPMPFVPHRYHRKGAAR